MDKTVYYHKKRWIIKWSAIIVFFSLLSCSSPKTFGLYCQERTVEIFADGEYLGRDLVYYTIPKDREYIEVSCRNGDIEIYKRRIYVKEQQGGLIELRIPKNYKYSTKPY